MTSAGTTTVLSARGIRKDFRDGRETVVVLQGVSLDLRRGEAVVLDGPSGSGKTTLLSILGCILTPTAGEVVIEGEPVDASRPARLAALRRRAIGFVFQQFNLFGALTAQENVEYALNLKGQHGVIARREAECWMERVGLADRRRFLPRDLSGGQKQRVAIARALAGEASVILADEPTANLDFHSGQLVLELFRQLAREHQRALLIVTHDPRVRPITDRTLFLRDGLLVDAPESSL
jgi:putative ABC transport system ATP-binding protein